MTIDHDDLRAKALAATPGEWRPHDTPGQWQLHQVVRGPDDDYVARVNRGLFNWRGNLAFIAAASPATVLSLLDEMAALRKVCRMGAWRGRRLPRLAGYGDDYRQP